MLRIITRGANETLETNQATIAYGARPLVMNSIFHVISSTSGPNRHATQLVVNAISTTNPW